MRLFAAVRPSAAALEHLDVALGGVRGDSGPAGWRWVPPENRHATMAFYGYAPDGSVDDVARRLDEACSGVAGFEARLRGAGSFGGRNLWIGCSGGGWTELMRLAGDVGSQVLGRVPDRRSRPHLTVARVSGRSRATGRADPGRLEAITRALAVYEGPAWHVEEVLLMSSELGAGPGGAPRYDVLHRAVLPAVAG